MRIARERELALFLTLPPTHARTHTHTHTHTRTHTSAFSFSLLFSSALLFRLSIVSSCRSFTCRASDASSCPVSIATSSRSAASAFSCAISRERYRPTSWFCVVKLCEEGV